jgi:hypothetical protein
MPLIPILLAIAVVLGLAFRGSLGNFERMSLHWWGLAVAGLALQAVPVPHLPGLSIRGSGALTLIASYLCLLAFLFLNRRIPAAPAMAVGLLLNVTVVGVNAGMPVGLSAIEVASGPSSAGTPSTSPKHHLMTDADSLTLLADVIPVPPPFGVVISIGDVFLYGGMGWFVFQVTRGRSRVNPRPIAMWFPAYRGKHAPDHWRLASRSREAARAAATRSGTEP